MRINRFLARAGVASRRKAEAFVLAGRVRVNGRTVRELGTRVDPDQDRVELDGKPVAPAEAARLWAYYKPRGVLSTLSDPRGRPHLGPVVRRLGPAVVPVGRLDRDSEGLLLLTDQGKWVAQLTHPRYGAVKQYHVVATGTPPHDWPAQLTQLRELGDGQPLAHPIRPLQVHQREGGKWVCQLALQEGKHRQIRRAFAALQLEVVRLVRTSEAGIELGRMRPGQVRRLGKRAQARLRAELARTAHDQ